MFTARNKEEIAQHVNGGVDPNVFCYEGYHDVGSVTALMLASIMGYSEMVQMLVQAGADANYQTSANGWTALMWAAWKGHLEVVRVLLEWGADQNLQDKNGQTALVWAAWNDKLEVVRILLEWGADKNLQDKNGQTALAWAAWNYKLEVVRMLLEWGADKNLQDKTGKTAADLAKTEQIRTLINTHVFLGTLPASKYRPSTTASEAAARNNHTGGNSNLGHFPAAIVPPALPPTPQVPVPPVPVPTPAAANTTFTTSWWRATTASASVPPALPSTPPVPAPTPAAANTASSTSTTTATASASTTLSSTTVEADSNRPVLPSPAEVAAAECAELQGECDALGEQVAQAPARRDAMQRRDALQAQLDAAEAAGTNFKQMGILGRALNEVHAEIAQLLLSEDDYLTLAARHAALVQRVEAKCRELLKGKHYDLLTNLGAKLEQLQALDLTAVLSPSEMDPVWVQQAAAVDVPVSAAANDPSVDDDDGENDPVWVDTSASAGQGDKTR